MKRTLIYGLLLLVFLGAGTGLVLQYREIGDQTDVIETASGIISSYGDQLDVQQGVIDGMLDENNSLVNEIRILEDAVSELEDVANSRRCQSIDLLQYENDIYRGTSYVITPAKMGWNGYWTIRENVVLERDYGLARGFEFRIDLTPGDYSDFWQEIHTTIRPFSSAEEAEARFAESQPDGARSLETSLDFGIPLRTWGANPNDAANTMKIEFLCGNYRVEVKLKYISDSVVALPILEQAATILFGELSQWAP